MSESPPASRENKQHVAQLLHSGHALTLDEVAEELQVTERTARRTLRALEAEGLPIRTRFVDGHKLHYLEEGDRDAPLAPLALTEREALALAVAAEVAAPMLQSTPLAPALAAARTRLLGSTRIFVFETAGDSVGGDVEPAEATPGRPEVFEAVRRAVHERRSLTISYLNAQGQRAWGRVIDPYLVAAVGGSWIVVARDRHHGQIVHFSLAAIDEAALGEPFEPAEAFGQMSTPAPHDENAAS